MSENEDTPATAGMSALQKKARIENRQELRENVEDAALSLEDQIKASLEKGQAGLKKHIQKKKLKKYAILMVVALVGFWLYNWLFSPFKGGMDFGVCRVFLEQQVAYPDSLRLSYVENFKGSVRIWYAQTDPYGQTRIEALQCYYTHDPVRGTLLDKATINRREVDPAIVKQFNVGLPAVFSYPPDLTYPAGFPDSLKALKSGN